MALTGELGLETEVLIALVPQEVEDTVAEDPDGGDDGLLQCIVVRVEVNTCRRGRASEAGVRPMLEGCLTFVLSSFVRKRNWVFVVVRPVLEGCLTFVVSSFIRKRGDLFI